MTVSPEERFWAKVQKTETCWNWTASKVPTGYGQFGVGGGRNMLAHRYCFKLTHGWLPKVLDHVCRNRSCVNPEHLRPATAKLNAENLGIPMDNKSGHRGVSWSKTAKKWVVQVGHNGRRVIGGYFSDVDEAGRVARELRLNLFSFNELDKESAIL